MLVDDRELLAGTLDAPAQAVVSRNRALTGLARTRSASDARTQVASPAPAETETDWLVWEADKQRRLRLLTGGSDVA